MFSDVRWENRIFKKTQNYGFKMILKNELVGVELEQVPVAWQDEKYWRKATQWRQFVPLHH